MAPNIRLERGEHNCTGRVETKMFVFVFSRNFFRFSKKCLRKVTKIMKFFAKIAKTKIFAETFVQTKFSRKRSFLVKNNVDKASSQFLVVSFVKTNIYAKTKFLRKLAQTRTFSRKFAQFCFLQKRKIGFRFYPM
jgi:hypothetical protein